MNIGTIHPTDINKEMQEAYLDYAMSVIVSRALPDVRDGLKPVHRRILYAMHDMGLQANQPYKKSARIVGEVLGKYHPHGDAAVYDAMVRMAQDFSMRLPLVDGQGNFGSIDGDRPAAMRYTEARLTNLANEIMVDIDQNTVDFVDNFDGSLREPGVVPTRFPNFLVNGATGIAVGMATSVPPHNLDEVCDALSFVIDQQLAGDEVTIDQVMDFINGPDFPTGGIIHRYTTAADTENATDRLKAAYAVGRGRITVQAKAHIEETSRNRYRLIVTELPYQTNKANLVEKIADLVRDEKLEGISDLRDESDRNGMRLVIELSRLVEPKTVLAQLFKLTPMQSTFSINMLALVDGEPMLVSLKRALTLFIEHRQTIITRRSNHQLDQARQRLHILEGLRVALANLSEVVQLIIQSKSAEVARTNICETYSLTEEQATAILNIPLRRLAALEREKIETEYQDLLARIAELEDLLNNPHKILQLIKSDVQEIKRNYTSPRYTTILDRPLAKGEVITADDLVTHETVLVALSRGGQLCRWSADSSLTPARTRQDDPLHVAIAATTRDLLYLFTANGQAVVIPMRQIPEGSGPGEGVPLSELALNVTAPIVAGIGLQEGQTSGYLCLVSQQGRIKRITLTDLATVRGSETVVMGLDEQDTLLTAFRTSGEGEVLLVTRQGQSIRFAEEEVRAMGLPAAGVKSMKLSQNDCLAGACLVDAAADVLIVTAGGLGKRTPLDEYGSQARYGSGSTAITLPLDGTGDCVTDVAMLTDSDRILLVSDNRYSKLSLGKSIPTLPRTAEGEKLIALRGRDTLVDLIVWRGT